MHRRSLPQEAIDQIKAAGYRVFMRDRADSYAKFGNETGVGSIEFDPMAGYTISTVHAPNRESGTGYQIERHVSAITPDMLHAAVGTHVPSWHRRDTPPRKYDSIDAYLAVDKWNAGFREV